MIPVAFPSAAAPDPVDDDDDDGGSGLMVSVLKCIME